MSNGRTRQERPQSWLTRYCHDLAYGESLPTTGRITRGLSQHTYLDYVQVRMPTGPVPLPVDGTFRITGLRSRTTRRDLGTE